MSGVSGFVKFGCCGYTTHPALRPVPPSLLTQTRTSPQQEHLFFILKRTLVIVQMLISWKGMFDVLATKCVFKAACCLHFEG